MPTPIKREELPQTLTRLKWAAKIMVSPDTTDIFGFPQALTAAVALSGSPQTQSQLSKLIASSLQLVGAIESLENVQTRNIVERQGFNSNPQEPFQLVPTQFSKLLKMTKAVLYSASVAERVFNFYPGNLAHQQVPFIIQITEPSSVPSSGFVNHYFFNCWFSDTMQRYDVTDQANVKLMRSATIKCGRMITLDDSAQGTATAELAGTFGGIFIQNGPQELIDNLNLT